MLLRRGLPGPLQTKTSLSAQSPRALAIGSFDGLHLGHQALIHQLRQAKAEGLRATLLTFHPHPRAYFQPDQAPGRILPFRDKVETLRAMGVDELWILPFDGRLARLSARDFVEQVLVQGLQAKAIFVGDDFRFGARRQGDLALLREMGPDLGFTVNGLADVKDAAGRLSSTRLREALQAGDMAMTAALLGRPYRLSGHVIHGQKLGRTLGIPTLNLRMPEDLLAHGIFACWVHGLEDRPLPGVASLGRRPVVEDQGRLLLEVHLLDWQGDAYGRLVSVELQQFLRAESHYDSLDRMMDQIAIDLRQARMALTSPPHPPQTRS